jgi:hypothetical protein
LADHDRGVGVDQQDDIASMLQRLEVSVAQRVEVTNINEVGSLTAKAMVLATQQDEKREQLESRGSGTQ